MPKGPQYGQPPAQFPSYGQPGGQGQGGYGQPGNQPPVQRPVRQRPSKAPERELRQRAIASLVFGAVGMIALLGLSTNLHKGVYLLIFSAVIGLAGCVIGITALVKARKTGTYRPRGAIGGIVLGAFAMLISVPILLTYLAFPTQVTNYVNCLSQTQSNSAAQRACMAKFYKSIHLNSQASPAALPAPLVRHTPGH